MKCERCGKDAVAPLTLPYSHNDLCGIPEQAITPCAALAAMLNREPRWILQRLLSRATYGTGKTDAPCPICGKPQLACICPMYDPRSGIMSSHPNPFDEHTHVMLPKQPNPLSPAPQPPDAPAPCMHSFMGHMCKAQGGPKDTCDCYPAPQAPDALAADCRAMATACDTLGHRDCAYTLRQAAQRIEALQAVADAARDVMAAVKYGVRGRMAVCPTPRVAALEAALAKLEETTC